MSDIASRLARIRERVEAAVRRRGGGDAVTLIGVSKRQPVDAIRAAHAAGLRDFGENYAQELRDKVSELDALDARWHFIGGLQSNKVKYVVGRTPIPILIHTVDRASLLTAIDKRAGSADVVQEVLVEVNLGEQQKAGVEIDAVAPLLDAFAATEHVRCVGLMVIPPASPTGAPEQTRPHFRALRTLRDELARTARRNVDLRHLSMGMSSDFEVAIEEGATLVRVGTAIFGPRPRPA
jgi:pyridoxal phosphate enzyme (YggS family)